MTIYAPKPILLNPTPIRVSLHPEVNCGWPSPALDYEEPPLSLDELVGVSACSTFYAVARGHSMTGADIRDGDILVIDKAATPGIDDVVVAVVNNDFTVKRLKKIDGTLCLVPDNPDMLPLTFGDGEEVILWGTVTWVLRKLH